MVLGAFGGTVFPWEHAAPRDDGPPPLRPPRAPTHPPRVHVQPQPRSTSLTRYDERDDDVEKGHIEAVPAGEPTEWCPNGGIAKKGGTPRRTVTFSALPGEPRGHTTPDPLQIVSSVPKITFKTGGRYRVPQAPLAGRAASHNIHPPRGRTFSRRTPRGKLRFAGRVTKRLTTPSPTARKLKCVDDTLPHDSSVTTPSGTHTIFSRGAGGGVTLHLKIFPLRRSVTFAGYLLGGKGTSQPRPV
ncbi:hypothetical protein GWK47_044083 [Chionoecetes opilio]|uniref:Uncharacterized protein n=1 Tax=Chionoecetes opilio TaxID=41210 RepID=A0A8J4YGX7_CHIOP|nr:hypothetical protein GWK47_044083 [Chionoecetes opilio]